MHTVIETPVYAKKADRLLTDEERETLLPSFPRTLMPELWCVGPAAFEK